MSRPSEGPSYKGLGAYLILPWESLFTNTISLIIICNPRTYDIVNSVSYIPIILLMKGFVYPIYADNINMHVPTRVWKAPCYKGFAHPIPRIVHR